jgi:hypothetical protein
MMQPGVTNGADEQGARRVVILHGSIGSAPVDKPAMPFAAGPAMP